MAVELRSLRITADMDASTYVRGMNQKVAADKAASASAKEVSAAGKDMAASSDAVVIRVNNQVSALERLSRQHIDGYGTAQKFNSEILRLAKATDSQSVSVAHLEQIYSGMQSRYGLIADGTDLAARGYTELAAAISNVNSKLTTHEALSQRVANVNKPVNNFQATNVAYQLQDIISTAALGSSPMTVALQQGPQLASVFGETGAAGAVKTLGQAFMSLVSPVSLVTIGLTAAGAAAIQYFTSGHDEAKTFDEIIKRHQQNIRDIKDSWGEAASGLQEYVKDGASVTQANAQLNMDAAQKAINGAAQSKLRQALNYPASDFAGNVDVIDQFRAAINDLRMSMAAGHPDLLQYREELSQIIVSPEASASQKHLADVLRTLDDETLNTARALPMMEKALGTIGATAGAQVGQIQSLSKAFSEMASIAAKPLTQAEQLKQAYESALQADPKSRSAQIAYDAGLGRIRDQQQQQIDQAKRQYDADIAGMNARSPLERGAAARSREAATINPEESDEQRNSRISLAGMKAQQEAENQLKQAQEDRARSLDQTLTQQQQELALVSQTGGAAEALRLQYQLLNQVYEEAAKNHTEADPKEIAAIKEKTAEYGKMVDQISRAKLSSDLAFQQRLAALSPTDQTVLQTLKQYNLPQDLTSQDANTIRDNLKMTELRDNVKGFFTDFRDGLMQGDNFGQALGSALLNSLNKALTNVSDSLINSLVNDILGTSKGGDAGGLVTRLLGGTAANDNFKTNTTLGDFLGSSGTSSASNLSSYAKAIQSVESGGNYGALGPLTASGDRAYGAYQVMGANIPSWTKSALGSSMSPSEFLGNKSAQDAVFEKYFGSALSKYGNPQDAASTWFSGRPLSQAANASDGYNTASQYVDKFNKALGSSAGDVSSLGGASSQVAQGLGSLGSGLNQFSNQLLAAASGANSPGPSLLGGLGRLVGGISPTSSLWEANTTLGDFLTKGFASGGYTGAGGVDAPRGIVHAGEIVWSQSDIAKAGGVGVVEGMRQGWRGYADGGLVGADRSPTFGQSGSEARGRNGDGSRTHVTVGVSVDNNGNLQAYVKNVAQGEAQKATNDGLDTYDQGFASKMDYYQNHKRRGTGRTASR